MKITARHRVIILILVCMIPSFAVVHLLCGQIDISIGEFMDAIFHYNPDDTNHYIIRDIRLPRLAMAIIAGGGLSIAGLLMQTLFNNPLAGPFVLGINSGASLFVAFSLMTGIEFLTSDWGTAASALVGAFAFGLIILSFSYTVKSHISLLLIGLMLGSFTSAVVYILQSVSTAEELKAFTMWAMGSLQRVELNQLPLITVSFLAGVIGSLFIVKPLNILVMGESDAQLLGVRIKTIRLLIIMITALLTGLITAYCGPIAFVGLAIPNLVRILFKTRNHKVLLFASFLMGGVFLLCSDIIIQLLEQHFIVPINALTSLVGAPFVVFIVLKKLA